MSNFIYKYSLSWFLGLILFLGFSTYSLVINSGLYSKLKEIERENTRLRTDVYELKTSLLLIKSYVGTKLPPFWLHGGGNQVYSSDSLKAHQMSVIILILSRCASCFENEIPLWNGLADNLRNESTLTLGINISLDTNLVWQYVKDGTVTFPMVNDNGVFSTFFQDVERTAQVLAILANSSYSILAIHSSVLGHPEFTGKFCDDIINYVKVQKPRVKETTKKMF